MDAPSILEGFSPAPQFAADNEINLRTVDRYRAEGLPWTRWGGRIFIGPQEEVRAWLLRRVRRTEGAK
jgi:hypothetical protein